MEKILRSAHALRLFFLVTAGIGWATAHYEKSLLASSTPIAVAVFDSALTIVALFAFVLVRRGIKGIAEEASQVVDLARNEASRAGLLAVVGAASGLLGTSLLKHHGVEDYQLSGLVISLVVGAVGAYAVGDGAVSWGRGAGLALVAIGGYLSLRG